MNRVGWVGIPLKVCVHFSSVIQIIHRDRYAVPRIIDNYTAKHLLDLKGDFKVGDRVRQKLPTPLTFDASLIEAKERGSAGPVTRAQNGIDVNARNARP